MGQHGHEVEDQRLSADVFRLQTLVREGGFYCDLDFVFLKPFDVLRHHDAIIGTQCRQKMKLACGLMGCVPGSAFIQAYLDKYNDWQPSDAKTFWGYANRVPWDIAAQMPSRVHVFPRVAFYPLTWSNKTFWEGAPIKLTNTFAIHLWETLNPTLTVDDLRKTCLRDAIERLDAVPAGVVKVTPGILMVF